jgi:hypothetical protein
LPRLRPSRGKSLAGNENPMAEAQGKGELPRTFATVVHVLADAAARSPGGIALACGEKSLTYVQYLTASLASLANSRDTAGARGLRSCSAIRLICRLQCSRPDGNPDRAGSATHDHWQDRSGRPARLAIAQTRWSLISGVRPMAPTMPFLSAFALHRFVREPLELDHKWMRHLTLRHYQACGILSRRNPPLGTSTSAPKELASRVLMVERRRLQDQRSGEPVPLAFEFPVSRKAYPHTL